MKITLEGGSPLASTPAGGTVVCTTGYSTAESLSGSGRWLGARSVSTKRLASLILVNMLQTYENDRQLCSKCSL